MFLYFNIYFFFKSPHFLWPPGRLGPDRSHRYKLGKKREKETPEIKKMTTMGKVTRDGEKGDLRSASPYESNTETRARRRE